MPRTLSRTTNGPLMPPIVLYRMRGWTDIMRGSITSGMMAVVSASSRGWVSVEEVSLAAGGACRAVEAVGEDEGRRGGWSLELPG
jgi:hypothetical protein